MSALSLARVRALLTVPSPSLPVSARTAGWLVSCRMSKRVGFLVLSDGSSIEPLQVVVPEALLAAQPELRRLTPGCAVRVEGKLVASLGAGQRVELQARCVEVVGWVADPERYPIQARPLSAEFLRTVPHLRHRVAHQAAVARLRHVLARSVHDHLSDQGFVWVATPLLTGADAEGAGERFQVTTSAGPPAFFGAPAHLTVSGQLEAEALSMALARVYTFGPTFRAEPSRTSRHLAEFWMVEPEIAFAQLSDVMALAEGLVKRCVSDALTQLPAEMALFSQTAPAPAVAWETVVTDPFARWTYTDAVDALRASGVAFDSPVAWGVDLQAEHERWLVAHVGRPVFVTDYPADLKPFYMKPSGDGRTVAAMDLLVPGLGELVGGSEREDDAAALEARLVARGMDPLAYSAYLDLRRCGGARHGGFGLGFERLVAWVAGLGSVREAIAYPAYAGHLASGSGGEGA